ncbi:hypothetical protein [Streptomyces sp. NPDC059649]|uniref:hypothetical protein n=1 Tax=Streptomyces sp. NPDC059649 TaxID=3346895 RepID=UPI003679B433
MRLRTSHPDPPGYRSVRQGRGFRHLDTHGAPLTDAAERRRRTALAVPPAWRAVGICPWPNGHLKAVGTDAAGRRQYLSWTRNETWPTDRPPAANRPVSNHTCAPSGPHLPFRAREMTPPEAAHRPYAPPRAR